MSAFVHDEVRAIDEKIAAVRRKSVPKESNVKHHPRRQ